MRTLRILHLEDNGNDAELVAATLAAEAIQCELIRVDSRAGFVAALENSDVDLILSDYSLPGFDGVTAHTIARASRPEIPFLFVSGTMGEEVAIDCLKDGATDYVLKHRLSRLVPAVRRALDETRNRRERAAAEAEVRRLNRELQIALGQATSLLDSVIENLPDVVSVKDARDLRYVRVNRACEDLLGAPRRDLLGRAVGELFPPHVATAIETADRAALAVRAVSEDTEEVVPSRDRGPRVFHTRRMPLLDASGAPTHLVTISADITERRAAEEDVRLSKLEAERANRAKSEFLSRMSHDLRTPLNAVLGFAQVLQLDNLPPEQADGLQQIVAGGRHLLDLINEVLDISRIESGHLSLSLEPVGVTDIVQHGTALIAPLAAARGIRVVIDAEPAEARYVRADRQRLNQILLNYLGNAVKYNRDHGTVTVTARLQPDQRIRFSVTDTGAGIPSEKLALLFQPFERLGAEQSAIEGTGLGLAVAKGLAEAMRGVVGVESAVDRGSTFWVELPEAAPPETRPEPPAEPEIRDRDAATESHGTILYVEDNQSNVRLLQRLLGRRSTVRLVTAHTGAEGLDLARRERPDLILLDLHLPDMSGEDVLRYLWTNPATRSLPVAVLSADATSSQRQRLLASGAIAYLTKPLDLTQLLRLIDERLASHP
jgi:PAS domain S-box-containing protein